jgi:hypothetical protein
MLLFQSTFNSNQLPYQSLLCFLFQVLYQFHTQQEVHGNPIQIFSLHGNQSKLHILLQYPMIYKKSVVLTLIVPAAIWP